MTIKILAYKNGSESARSLRDALGIKMLKKQGSKWAGKAGDTVINWGSSAPFAGNMGAAQYLNKPDAVARAANKLRTQECFAADAVASQYRLPHMTSKALAQTSIEHGMTVVCRTKLTGNSGDGIVIATKVDELVDAPLYTIYKKKQQEYRVHVFDGKVISVQRKARKNDVEDDKVNWQVRNIEGGFIFARTGFDVPRVVTRAAKAAIKALGLDFGAVDIGHHDKEGTFVYEVNTACGLSGSNLTDYVEAFCKKLGLPEPVRQEGYVPPTIPADGEEGVAAAPEVALVPDIPELRRIAVQGVKVDKRAALGTKENPLGNSKAGAVLRQIRVNLAEEDENTNEDMVDNYAGKWAWFITTMPEANKYPYRINGMAQWCWGEGHLEPLVKEVMIGGEVHLGEADIQFKVGNINKVVTPAQQLQLAALIAKF